MKIVAIIVFLGTAFISVCMSAVLPLSKYSLRPTETTSIQHANETTESLVIVAEPSQSISLESSLNVLRTITDSRDSKTLDWDKFLNLNSKISTGNSKDSVISKNHLNASKYRIRHPPTYFIPIDIEPNTTARLVETSSVAINQTSATPLSSTVYQSLIKVERKRKAENFMQFISTFASNEEKIAEDRLKPVYGKSISLIQASELPSKDVQKLLQKQLTTIFTVSNPSVSPIIGCHKPEVIISMKCLSNFARLTFLSEELSNAKIALIPRNESVELGSNSVIYIHWWDKNGIIKTTMNNILTIGQFKSTCHHCHNLNANLLLHDGGQGCVIPVTCNSSGSGKVKVDESYKTSANLKDFAKPVISVSLSFHSLGEKAMQDGGIVKSGQQIAISIAGVSETFPVGLFVKEVHVSIANGPSVTLLSNGCSISNLLENFNLTSTRLNNIEVFRLTSHFRTYNSEKISLPLKFKCKIMVCEGECGSHSACQRQLTNHSKSSKSRTIFEETLRKTIVIDPEGSEESESVLLQELLKENVNTPENFISAKKFYATLFIVSCIFTIILMFCVLCMKYYLTRPKVYMNELDDTTITTPERSFLNMDHVSARRRSPTSTTIYD